MREIIERNYNCIGVHYDARNGFYALRFDLMNDGEQPVYVLHDVTSQDSGYDSPDSTDRQTLITYDVCVSGITRLLEIQKQSVDEYYKDVLGNFPKPLVKKLLKQTPENVRYKYVNGLTEIEDNFSLLTNILGSNRLKISNSSLAGLQNIFSEFTTKTSYDLKQMKDGQGTLQSCLLAVFNSICYLENQMIEYDLV